MTGQKRLFAFLGILTGLLFVQACGRELPTEEPCNFVQNQNVQRVSWDQNQIVELHLDSSVPADFQTAIYAAATQWNKIGQDLRKRDFFRIRAGNPGASHPTQDGYSKIYVLKDWEDSKSTEQARTTIYWSGSRIYEADIRINEKDFDFYSSDTPDYSRVHLESLIIHELGHVLGLAHMGHDESVMQVSLANGKNRTEPGRIDIDSLACEY